MSKIWWAIPLLVGEPTLNLSTFFRTPYIKSHTFIHQSPFDLFVYNNLYFYKISVYPQFTMFVYNIVYKKLYLF